MVILLAHNGYRESGGEERAVAEQAALLSAGGHQVRVLQPSSKGLVGTKGGLRAARALLRGGGFEEQIRQIVARERVDVMHAHNIHPLLGARALAAARDAGARTVLQLHNFRLVCAIGVAYRDGEVCHRCSGRDTLPGVRLRCRGGLAESVVYAAGLARQQPLILAASDRFVTLSEATRRTLGELGLPLDRAEVIANPLPQDAFSDRSGADRGRFALCVGRLVEEKGFDVAIAAATTVGVPLRIVGDGPDRRRLAALSSGLDVALLGRLSATELERVRGEAAMVLAPSRCEEQSPYAVLEAMAAGVPVVGSSLGGLPELAGEDSCVPVGDTEAWAEAIDTLWRDPRGRRERGERARERAWGRSSPERVYEQLMGVYQRARAQGSNLSAHV